MEKKKMHKAKEHHKMAKHHHKMADKLMKEAHKHAKKADGLYAKAEKHHAKHEKHHSKKHEAKEHRAKKAMHHKDVLGAGAKKRKALPAQEKVGVVMKEFKRGTLNSGSGAKVTNPKQAIAIGLSEARKATGKKRRK